MSPYEPFPVYDLKSGLQLDRDPWLLPADAFKKLENAYLRQGILHKRRGYKEWGRFVNAVDDESLGTTVDQQLTYNGTLSNTPLRPGDLVISTSGGGETFTDNGDGTLTGSSGGSGTINYTTGAWSITYNSNPGGGLSITADYDYYPGNAIMGLFNFYTSTGTTQFLVFDTKRINKYDTVNSKLEDVLGTNTFTGTDNDFFWVENWLDRFFITNNKDQQKIYDGTTLSNLSIDYDGDESNDVNSCLLIFSYKSRLVILRPTEKGNLKPQRARWGKVGTYSDFTNDGFVDAPTIDWIVAADFIGDDLVVFFERSVWILKYTGNATLPFRWEKLESTEGAYSTHSIMPFSDELLALGPVGLIGTDAMQVYKIGQKIPDIVLDFEQDKFNLCYGAIVEEERQNWLTYPSIGSDYADHVLVLNYEDNNYAIFVLSIHSIGYFQKTDSDLTWDDIDETWDEIEWSWDEKSLQAGYPITLGGNITGRIYELNYGGEDAGQAISVEVESGQWNPYVKQGQKARFGYIDFLVNRDPTIDINVDFYEGKSTIPYQTKTLNCGGDGSDEEKVWVRLFSGAVGPFHKIRLYHTAKNQTFRIHAIIPYFKPAGRIY